MEAVEAAGARRDAGALCWLSRPVSHGSVEGTPRRIGPITPWSEANKNARCQNIGTPGLAWRGREPGL